MNKQTSLLEPETEAAAPQEHPKPAPAQLPAKAEQAEETTIARRPIAVGAGGLSLQTLDDMWRFAKITFASRLAPAALDSVEKIFIGLQLGLECGLTPMAAIQNVAVINGKPSLYGEVVLGLCRTKADWDESQFAETITGDGDKMVARCTVCRKGGNPHTSEFSVDDAKKASLWGKKGPWESYPKRMLKMRARGFALKDIFGHHLHGIGIAEEQQDIEDARIIESVAQRIEHRQPGVAGLADAMGVNAQTEPQPGTADPAPEHPMQWWRNQCELVADAEGAEAFGKTLDDAVESGEIPAQLASELKGRLAKRKL